MYNINYLIDLGQHHMTVTHPHYKNIYENQSKLKFNFTKSGEVNPKYKEYLEKYRKTALEIGCLEEDIDFFISALHPNSDKQPHGFSFSPTHAYFGPEKHVINLEHWDSVFGYMFVHSNTRHSGDIDFDNSPFFKLVAAAFLQDSFCGILSHMHDTINAYKILMKEFPEIHNKFIYFPLASPEASEDKQPKVYNDRLNVLFTNSYGGQMGNFPLRGGSESFNAIMSIINEYPNLWFTTIGPCPSINHPRVTQYNHLDEEQFNSIIDQTHVLLIPAMRIHTISLVKALCNGIIPLVSDGWGFDEYIQHMDNGIVVRGQWGRTSWKNKHDIFVENYEATADPSMVHGIIRELKFLLRHPDIIEGFSRDCLEYARQNFNIDKRNKILEDLVKQHYDS